MMSMKSLGDNFLAKKTLVGELKDEEGRKVFANNNSDHSWILVRLVYSFYNRA